MYLWEEARYSFIRFLRHKIAKCKEWEVMPHWVRIIFNILFPFHWLYENQSQVYFDPVMNVYKIRGIKLSADVLDFYKNPENVGKTFKLLSNNPDYITIREITHE